MTNRGRRPDGAAGGLPARGLLGWMLRRYAYWVCGGALAGIVWRLLTFAPPVALGRAIDEGVVGSDTEAGLLWVGVAAALALLIALTSALRHWFAVMGYFSAHDDMRRRLISFAQRLDLDWHTARPRGEVLSRVNADSRAATTLLDEIPSFSGGVVSLVVTSASLAFVSVQLALIAAATLPAVLLAVVISGRKIRARATQLQDSTAEMTGTLEETLAGIIVIKSLGAEEARMQVLERDSDAVRVSSTQLERMWGVLGAVAAIVPAIAIGAGVWVGGNQVADGEITLGQLAAFVGWMLIYQELISAIGERVAGLIRSMAAMRRLEEVLSEEPRTWGARTDVPSRPDLAVESVTVRRGRRTLLDGVSLRIEPGERLAITGATGSGKSTLLGALPGLVAAEAGRVLLGGVPIEQYSLETLRRAVIMVTDEAFLFEDSVRANLTLGEPGFADAELWQALRLARVEDLVRGMDGGLDAQLGHAGRELSGGEMQRLCLARALIRRPAVLILDDSLSAVDQETEAAILANLQDWPGSVVFTSNRPLMRSFATRSLLLENGRLATPGVPSPASPSAPDYGRQEAAAGSLRIEVIEDGAADRHGANLESGENVSGVLGRAWPMLKSFVPRMALAALLSVAATACVLTGPQIVRFAVDDGLVQGETGLLLPLALAYVLVGVGDGLAYYCFISVSAAAGESALHSVRVRTWGALHLQPLAFFETIRTGELVSRCTDDIQHLSQFIRSGLERLVTTTILLTMGLAFMLATSWRLTLVGLGIMAVNLVALYFYARLSPPKYAAWDQADAEAVDALNQAISGVSVTQALGAEQYARARSEAKGRRYIAASRSMTGFENRIFFPFELISASTPALVVGAGVLMVSQGITSIGSVVAMAVYTQLLLEPLGIVTEIVGSTQKARVALARLLSLQELPAEAAEDAAGHLPSRGTLEVQQVSFAYQAERPVLRDVSFSVPPGRRVALIGPTGAGKSTLAKLIAGLERPHRGHVRLSGADLHGSSIEHRRQAVAYIPQSGHLFSGTIAQNLRLARADASEEEMLRALEFAGLSELIERLPGGLDSPVGRQGGLLSAGERQLVALARLALRDPAVILLDESTSRIDDGSEVTLGESLRRLGIGRSLIVIAHRPSTIAMADEVMELRDGKLLAVKTASDEPA